MTGTTVVSIVAILGALLLALRNLRTGSMPARTWWTLAAAWVVIIIGAMVLINVSSLGTSS